jgi:hypothetical protein
MSDMRQQLAQDAAVSPVSVTAADLVWFAHTFADLAEPEVIAEAWD